MLLAMLEERALTIELLIDTTGKDAIKIYIDM